MHKKSHLFLRCTRTLIALTLTAGMSGCTSLQWRDSNGVEHHLGLVAQEISYWEYGTQLRRLSFGIDVRLSGPDRGISLGAKWITGLVPQVRIVERPEELPDEVLEYYKHTQATEHLAQAVKRRIIYFTEELSSGITLVDTHNLGFDWRLGPTSPGISLGYGASHQLVGQALDDGVVQIYLSPGDELKTEAIKMWTLKPVRQESPAE
jgi:hypothetical protein